MNQKRKINSMQINSMMRVIFLLIFAVAIIPSVRAQVVVGSFSTDPIVVAPGQQTSLSLTLVNEGDDDVENVVVALDLSKVPFAPVDSSTEKAINEIIDHDEGRVYFQIAALPDAVPLVYKIPLSITYDTKSKPALISTSLVSVTVQAHAQLDLLRENTDIVAVNQSGKVTLQFVNNGFTPLHVLKVTLKETPLYDIVSAPSLYIGDVNVGDFETGDFTLVPKVDNPILSVEFEYRDASNHLFKEQQLVQVPTYTAEQAQSLGLTKAASMFPTIALVIVIVVLGIVLLLRRRRKKKA